MTTVELQSPPSSEPNPPGRSPPCNTGGESKHTNHADQHTLHQLTHKSTTHPRRTAYMEGQGNGAQTKPHETEGTALQEWSASAKPRYFQLREEVRVPAFLDQTSVGCRASDLLCPHREGCWRMTCATPSTAHRAENATTMHTQATQGTGFQAGYKKEVKQHKKTSSGGHTLPVANVPKQSGT